jgi:putative oxidoreductase
MERFLGRYAPHLYALLRIIAGLMFAMHGTQKLFGWPGDQPRAGDPLMVAAGVIELVCGVLIAIGLFTSFAAFLASGQMAVAYFMKHAPEAFWPILNKGELAALYSFLFLFFAAHGAGIWSARRRDDGVPVLKRYEVIVYTALRVVAALLFLMHGTRKLAGWPGDGKPATAMLSIAGGWIEVITGTLIGIGLLTGYAAFLASGTMAVAYWLRHGMDAVWPIENRGELAVLYCFLFLYIAARGRKNNRSGSEDAAASAGGDAGAPR